MCIIVYKTPKTTTTQWGCECECWCGYELRIVNGEWWIGPFFRIYFLWIYNFELHFLVAIAIHSYWQWNIYNIYMPLYEFKIWNKSLVLLHYYVNNNNIQTVGCFVSYFSECDEISLISMSSIRLEWIYRITVGRLVGWLFFVVVSENHTRISPSGYIYSFSQFSTFILFHSMYIHA